MLEGGDDILSSCPTIEHSSIESLERLRCARVPSPLALPHSSNALIKGLVISRALGLNVVPPGHAWFDDNHPDPSRRELDPQNVRHRLKGLFGGEPHAQ